MRRFAVLLGILFISGCGTNKVFNNFALVPFEPLTEAKQWEIAAFYVVDAIDTTKIPKIVIPDTIQISWNAPTFRQAFDQQPVPKFHRHDPTKTKLIIVPNDVKLYRYVFVGNDTSIFVNKTVTDFETGVWEFAVACVDTFGLRSQYSEPFCVYIKRLGIPPSIPMDLFIILK